MSVGAVTAPRLMLRLFGAAPTAASPTAFRMFGIRNAVLAYYLVNIGEIRTPRRFLELNIACDVVDAVAVVGARRRGEVGLRAVILGFVVAVSAALAGSVWRAESAA